MLRGMTADRAPPSFIESAFSTRAEYAATLSLAPEARRGAFDLAAANNTTTANACDKRCTWCEATESLLRCSGCRAAWFCDNGQKCLREAWTKGGHKEACKAAAARQLSLLPAALKTTPQFAQRTTGAPSFLPLVSDAFDHDVLDEDDECGICKGDPLPRSGRGVVALQKCQHRFHRPCVAALRSRLVASPCPSCTADEEPPAWDDAIRKLVTIECRVSQGRARWNGLAEEEQQQVEMAGAQLKEAATQGVEAAAQILASLKLDLVGHAEACRALEGTAAGAGLLV